VSKIRFTRGQIHRLIELGAEPTELERDFETEAERDKEFNKIAENLARKNLKNIKDFLEQRRKPLVRVIEEKLRTTALRLGFSEVVTPIIIPRLFIKRMGIDEGDPLWKQVMLIDDKRALRPMLAPNLYVLMAKLSNIVRPVKIFEIGPCFRRETGGRYHLEEFTMFNMVELAPEGDPKERLLDYIDTIMRDIGLNYTISVEPSNVYGETLDVVVNGIEVASAAIGPKPIDANWGVHEPWIGVGFGVERLAMLVGGYNSIARIAKSLSYLDGSTLSVIKLRW